MKKPTPKCGSVLARKIASVLMENGFGEQAKRLQLRGKDEKDLGGYCRRAVVLLIDRELGKAKV